MATSLSVVKWQRTESGSLDCMLCSEKDNDQHFTVLAFWCNESGQAFNLCPEHLDGVVTSALARAAKGHEEKNSFWYLDEDEQLPWEGCE